MIYISFHKAAVCSMFQVKQIYINITVPIINFTDNQQYSYNEIWNMEHYDTCRFLTLPPSQHHSTDICPHHN